MKLKTRKSFQPSSIANATRVRQKFFTGVKRLQVSNQKNTKQSHSNPRHHGQSLVSDSILTIKQEGFQQEQLIRAFYSLSQEKQYIMAEDLTEFLQDQNEQDFKKYQMIRLLDKQGKGYVTIEEYLEFFMENTIANEENRPLPAQFAKKKKWKSAIEQNYEVLSKLQDKQYCAYVAAQIKRLRDVNITNNRK